MNAFLERHAEKIAGVLSCFDRVVITGNIPGICYAEGLTGYLKHLHIRIFDFSKWANPLRQRVRENAQQLADENQVEIKHLARRNIRKERVVADIIAKRGGHPGLVAILSAMEACPSFGPWHDKGSGRTYLRFEQGRCLHYYFYFILEDLGLCYLRVPTWAPFRLQFYFNGHHWLAGRLRKADVEFEMRDNAFVRIADYDKAQRLADGFNVRTLHRRLDRLARRCCPVIVDFPSGYHWSLLQVEYATDVAFKRQRDLAPLYQEIVHTAVHTVKPENVATFLGRKLHPSYRDELGNDFHTRVEGTRIKHHMGKVSVKMYDKFQLILRVETTANDVSFFKHHREVEHRDGTRELKFAPMKKGLYSLGPLREVMAACNRRYLEFVAAIDDPSANLKDLDRLSRPARQKGRSHRGFNVFHGDDAELLRVILDGGFCLSGFRNADIRRQFPGKRTSQVSLLLKRLRQHGLIKKAGRCYKYYLTRLGRRVGLMALKLKELFVIPVLRGQLTLSANS